ncbi:MAG: NAD(P)-dependent oxidoreductase, partial [Gammaproteobacteria bacterium]
LINTSRGGLIDETALLEGLRTGRIRGAALDVMNGEPAVAQSPLVEFARNNPHLIITPHSAGYSPEAVDKVCIRAASKVVEFFRSNSEDD